MMKTTIAFAAACMLIASPVLAQAPATPTGKSDTKAGMMKKGDGTKGHRMKKKHKTM